MKTKNYLQSIAGRLLMVAALLVAFSGRSWDAGYPAVGALPVPNADWAVGATGNGWGDDFAGAIDEVAIYNVALTPTQIQTHYSVAQNGVRLTYSRAGSSVSILYPAGTLQQSDVVTGPYTDVTGAGSPYPVPAGTARKFYRCRL